MKFAGHERDLANTSSAAGDLDYMHARLCNPQLGRFLSTDPAKRYKPTNNSARWNSYAYALAGPLKFVDPEGAQVAVAAAFEQNVQDYLDGKIDQKQFQAQNQARAAAGVIGNGVVLTGALGTEAVSALMTMARSLLLSPEAQIGAAQIVAGFASQLESGGGQGASEQLFTKLTQAPQAGRTLFAAGGEGAIAVAKASREEGKLFTARFPRALLNKLEHAKLLGRSLVIMQGKLAVEFKFRPEATKEIAKYFIEFEPE